MTVSLERLTDNSPTARNFLTLASLTLGTGGRELELRWGVGTLTFTASAGSAALNVTHGLGKAPVACFAAALNAGFGNVPYPVFSALGTTTFVLQGEVKTAFSGSVTMMWIAIG